MVTLGTKGSQRFWKSSCGSLKGRVVAFTTWPRMPPVSPAMYGVLPQSRILNMLTPPCQPSTSTLLGSMRPVDKPVQVEVLPSAFMVQLTGALLPPPCAALKLVFAHCGSPAAQYTVPGYCKEVGRENVSFE